MQTKENIRRCFLIGPMKDLKKMERLREKLLAPLLEPAGFLVTTPDQGNIGNIMQHVLLNLEQADLLVVDITGQNPNVMYELGIYHCFGKPYIILKDSSHKEDMSQLPFDIAQYWYDLIDYDNIEEAKQSVGKLVKKIMQQIDKRDWFGNPVTDFYDSPVAEIPTAIGLSKNYKQNFLGRILPSIFQKDQKGLGYLVDVWVETDETDADGSPQLRELTAIERSLMTLQILIPIKLSMTRHDFIESNKDAGKISFKSAQINRRSRPFKLYFYTDAKGNIVLIDIPTVLSTLNESIKQRRKLHEDQMNLEDWEILEAQELERFANKCELFKARLEDDFPVCKGKILIKWRWEPNSIHPDNV